MTVDVSAKRANIRMSVKKYLDDTLVTAAAIPLFFDKGFAFADTDEMTEWISVIFRKMSRGGLSDFYMDIVCATRGDAEGDRLSELSDIVFNVLTDSTMPDGKRRIDLYDVEQTPWATFGTLLVADVIDSDEMPAADNTKYLMLTCRMRWIAKA